MKIFLYILTLLLLVDAQSQRWQKVGKEKCKRSCTTLPVAVTYVQRCRQTECSYSHLLKYELDWCNPKTSCLANNFWMPWVKEKSEPCAVTCGYGTLRVNFKRSCTGNCTGPYIKTEFSICQIDKPCPVDGRWTVWKKVSVSLCNRSCKRNITFTRLCMNPYPMFGGKKCGSESQNIITKKCYGDSCVTVPGEWGAWVSLGACPNSTCRVHTKRLAYKRICLSSERACQGDLFKSVVVWCDANDDCKVKGGWTVWRIAGKAKCDPVTCVRKRGFMIFNRTCVRKHKCLGQNIKAVTFNCPVNECPVDGVWTEWELSDLAWCGRHCTRRVFYTRFCSNPAPGNGGRLCPGSDIKTITHSCEGDSCALVHGSWGQWTVVVESKCSARCGSGNMEVVSLRNCDNPPPRYGGRPCAGKHIKTVNQTCIRNSCIVTTDFDRSGGWTEWGEVKGQKCPVSCGVARMMKTFTRNCTQKRCDGNVVKNETVWCTSHVSCPDEGGWSQWTKVDNSNCTVTCGLGFRVTFFSRNCSSGEKTCQGNNTRKNIEICEKTVCPVDGQWSSWTLQTRSKCSVTCGQGTLLSLHSRSCSQPLYGGEFCAGLWYKTATETCQTTLICEQSDNSEWTSWVLVGDTECPQENCASKLVQKTFTRMCRNKTCVGSSGKEEYFWCPENCYEISVWQKSYTGKCSATCGVGLMQVFQRTCKVDDQKCATKKVKSSYEFCSTNIACPGTALSNEIAHWSLWVIDKSKFCPSTCTREAEYSRTCVGVAPPGVNLTCPGVSRKKILEPCYSGDCVSVGGWTPWVNIWKIKCQVSCGVGIGKTYYNRKCVFVNNNCTGDNKKMEFNVCHAENKCPVRGMWSDWTKHIGRCNVTCGRGNIHMVYTRRCDNPWPQYGGVMCQGQRSLTHLESCILPECESDTNGYEDEVGLTPWTEYPDECHYDCKRTVVLTRSCQPGAKLCAGIMAMDISEDCQGDQCTRVNGGWSEWETSFTDCSVTCGSGVIVSSETRQCKRPEPSNGGHKCLGQYQRMKTYKCYVKYSCNDSVEHEHENETFPRLLPDTWSDWKEVKAEQCQPSCERNVTFERRCLFYRHSRLKSMCPEVREIIISKHCDICEKVDGQWSSWSKYKSSDCHSVCYRMVTLVRACTSPEPRGGGSDCEGDYVKHQSESCTGDKCTVGQWSSWSTTASKCSSSCVRIVYHTRKCDNPPPSLAGLYCPGISQFEKTQYCYWENCEKKAENDDKSVPVLLILANITFFIFIIGSCCLYISIKREQKRTKKSEPQELDNPAFIKERSASKPSINTNSDKCSSKSSITSGCRLSPRPSITSATKCSPKTSATSLVKTSPRPSLTSAGKPSQKPSSASMAKQAEKKASAVSMDKQNVQDVDDVAGMSAGEPLTGRK